MRIVSLIASSTEIACALGFKDQLVGRSHECDYPPPIRTLPVCTETKFNPDGTSYEIDQRVKALLQEGLSVYRVLGERLRELKPDVILTQIQCEVCAVSKKDVEEATFSWLGTKPTIVSLNPASLAHLYEDVRAVAKALHAPDQGERLVAEMKTRMNAISERTASGVRRPRVACIEWIEPLMAAGNWVPELVALAGGENLFGEAGKHSPWMTMDEIVARDPDKIVVMPCGWDIERSAKDMPLLEADSRWKRLRAVRSRDVYLVDGNQYFNRPGPRIVESLEILEEILHGTSTRWQGSGWMKR